jgi:membrane fusion protein, multidrug efflux system
MRRLVLAAVAVALLGGAYVYRDALSAVVSGGKAPEQKGATRPPAGQLVLVDAVRDTSVPILVSAIGTVQSIATVIIKSRIDGQIADLHFEEGQEIKEGDLLFTLDNRAFVVQLRQAEATLERDKAQLQRANLELARQTELASRGSATAQKLEDAQTAVKMLEAAIRAGEAAAENARINLGYTTIRAPITGRTGAINLKRGNLVKSNDTTTQAVPLVTITQLRPIYVGFTVPERHLADIRKAVAGNERLSVLVTIPSQTGEPINGALTFVDNQVDVASGTIALKATFPNDDSRLWPGQFVNVTLTLGLQAHAIAVPSGAIQIGPNGPYVFVVKTDSTVELRLVTMDRTVNDLTVIAKGLAAGERVVVDGQLRLSNGTRVTVQQSPQRAPARAQAGPLAERQ